MFTLHDSSNYTSNTGRGTVRRSLSSSTLPVGIELSAGYPAVRELVAWAEAPHETQSLLAEAFLNATNDDRLWMFACSGARAEEARRRRTDLATSSQLRFLFDIGQFDWAEHHQPSPATTRSFRYTAAIGQELLRRIETSEDRVSVFWVILLKVKPLTLSAV